MRPTIINAPDAVINAESVSKSAKSVKRRRRRNNRKSKVPSAPVEESTSFGTTSVKKFSAPGWMNVPCHLHEAAEAWMRLYVDPRNPALNKAGARKIPDGALTISAEAGFLFASTITLPMTRRNEVDVSGKNFSLLGLMNCMLRALGIVLIHTQSRDFDQEVMNAFCIAWASIPNREAAYYPNWVPCPLYDTIDSFTVPVLYFTVLAPNALRAVQEPDEVGFSTLLNQFRFTSYGITYDHNTPTLFDQGTYVAGRFNCSVEPVEYTENHLRSFDPFWISLVINTTVPTVSITALATVAGVSQPPISELSYTGLLPSPGQVVTFTFRNRDGTFVVPAGDTVSWRIVGASVGIYHIESDNFLNLGVAVVGASYNKRLYSRIDLADTLSEVIDEEPMTFNKLLLPPVTQSDIVQMDAKSVSGLLKGDHELGGAGTFSGVYQANAIWEPVFNLQSASNFNKCVMVTQDTDLSDLTNPNTGWFDSFDRNFGWGVVNMQSVPWAAAPFIVINRTDEQVPGVNSIVGAYSTGCQVKEPLSVDVAMALSSRLPHGFSSSNAPHAKLFPRVRNALASIPRIIASATNILDMVNGVCDDLGV